MERVIGIALTYEDLDKYVPAATILAGKLKARRRICAPLAATSTLDRSEHAPSSKPDRYRKIGHDTKAIEALLVDFFLKAHEIPPEKIALDMGTTGDP